MLDAIAIREARMLRGRLVDDLWQDARYAVRSLAKAPAFALLAIGTLAVGIGAAVAIFTVVEAILLRPLPITEPGRLGVINAQDLKSHGLVGASWTKFELLRAQTGAFAGVGRAVRVDGRATTVIGVLPSGFRFDFADREPQIYLTHVETPGALTAVQIRNGAGFLGYVARLRPGATFEGARADLKAFDERYRRERASFTDAGKYELHLVPFVDSLVGAVRPALLVVMGAVLLLLAIACANVAHLLLARAAAVDALVAYGPASIPRLGDAAPDSLVMIFAVAIACATAIVFGIVPALRGASVAPGEALKDGRAGGMTGRRAGRLHEWIAASESAVTVVLLIGAGLLFESLVRLVTVNPGFDPHQVYATHLALPRDTYAERYQRDAFFTRLLQDLQARPGIAAVGATSYLPMGGSNYGFLFYVDGQARLGPGRDQVISARHVSADYFRVMRIPLRGRGFTAADTAQSRPVAIINETAARKFFPNVDPIGRHVANSGDAVMREIVGVAGDVLFDGPARERQEELYLPYRQVPWPSMALVVSSALPADAVAVEIRRAVAAIDAALAAAEIRPMDRVVAASTTQQQFTSGLVGVFALLAASLAAIGLYGVIALFVSQRLRARNPRGARRAARRSAAPGHAPGDEGHRAGHARRAGGRRRGEPRPSRAAVRDQRDAAGGVRCRRGGVDAHRPCGLLRAGSPRDCGGAGARAPGRLMAGGLALPFRLPCPASPSSDC
jgi:MacB-like protein